MKKLTQTNLKCSKSCPSFTKAFILFTMLTFTSFGFKARAQNQIDYSVNNQGGCDVTVKAFDFGGTQLYSLFCPSGALTNSTCFNKTTTVYRIDVIRLGCTTVSFYATSSTSGDITYSSVGAICTGCTYTSMTCAGSGGGNHCGGSNDYHYLVELLP